MEPSQKEFTLLGAIVYKHHPEIFNQYQDKIRKPEEVFRHYYRLPSLLKRFCQIKETNEDFVVGINKPLDHQILSRQLKHLFIGSIVCLYHTGLLTGYDEKAKDNLCEELSGLLQCKREAVSDHISDIKHELNPDKKFSTAYNLFKSDVAEIVDLLKSDLVAVDERQGSLFQ